MMRGDQKKRGIHPHPPWVFGIFQNPAHAGSIFVSLRKAILCYRLLGYIIIIYYTIWLFNIAMENHHL